MSLYSSQTISSYNASPPSDDGAEETQNKATWSGIKTKLGDPVKTLAEAINTQLVTSFASVAMEKISAATASAETSIDITGLSSDYQSYLLVFNNLFSSSDADTLSLRVSTDNGSTYIATASYSYAAVVPVSGASTSSLDDGGTPDTSIFISNLIGTGALEEKSGWIMLHDPLQSGAATQISYQVNGQTSNAQYASYIGGGMYRADAATDAFRLLMATGNISANYTLYGMIT